MSSTTFSAAAQAAQLQGVKQRLLRLLATPEEPQRVAKLDSHVAAILQRQVSDAADPRHGGWHEQHPPTVALYSGGGNMLYELLPLAIAWQEPGSRYHHDPKLQQQAQLAWQCCGRFLYPGCPFPGNWWSWQIGSPETLSAILLQAADVFTNEQRQQMLATLGYLVEHVPETHPGGNAMWGAMVYLRYGVLAEDPSYLQRASAYIGRASAITDHQGILKDYTYSFHGRGLNMGYGSMHLEYLGQFTYLLGDSPWRLSPATLDTTANVLLRFARWIVVGDTIDPFLIDRGISYGEDRFRAGALVNAALLLTSGPVAQRRELQELSRWMIDQGNPPTNAVAQEIARELNVPAAKPPTGMAWFPESEYAVMRQSDWCVSVKLASEKNKCYFGINKTNLKGWHSSDGQMIFRKDDQAYRGQVIPTMDWERLTGITRSASFKLPAETRGQSWFVEGGVSDDGQSGCCGILFTIINLDRSSINAFKSWFFLGDAIVALGASVTCDGPDEVETIIRHMPLPVPPAAAGSAPPQAASAAPQTQRPLVLASPDCAYILPQQPEVKVYEEERQGRWTDLRADALDAKVHSRRYWTALIPHGVRPKDQGYQVIYLPGKTAEQALQWWQQKPLEILQQDASLHVVLDRRRKRKLTVRCWVGATVEEA